MTDLFVIFHTRTRASVEAMNRGKLWIKVDASIDSRDECDDRLLSRQTGTIYLIQDRTCCGAAPVHCIIHMWKELTTLRIKKF